MWTPKKLLCQNGCQTKEFILERLSKYYVDQHGNQIAEAGFFTDWEYRYFCQECGDELFLKTDLDILEN